MNVTLWIVVALLVGAPLIWRLRPMRLEGVRLDTRVRRQVAPQVAPSKRSAVLVFRAGPGACELARRLDGQRRDGSSGATVPACSNGVCGCRYVAAVERRKGDERRLRNDRRDAVRFDTKKIDRRSRSDRRQSESAWVTGSFS